MIAAILFGLLFLIVISAVVVFIFEVLLPALKAQNVTLERTMFSESEIRIKPVFVEKYAKANGKKACVMCSSSKKVSARRFVYSAEKSCKMFDGVVDSEHDCRFGCIGFGDCMKSCTRGAITIINGTAVVNSLCNGCGKCIDRCPRKIIKLVPSTQEKAVLCSAAYDLSTQCSSYLAEENIAGRDNPVFFLWKKCYKLIRK